MLFLIEYDRPIGKIISLITFEDLERQHAEDSRLVLELALNRSGIEREVVLLQAKDEAALRRTHRRYFEDITELAELPRAS
jgi:hypothetical protein